MFYTYVDMFTPLLKYKIRYFIIYWFTLNMRRPREMIYTAGTTPMKNYA